MTNALVTNSLTSRFSDKYSVPEQEVVQILKQTCFKGQVSDAQMTALLVVADKYNLNPFLKEIYAFDDKRGGIIPIVSIDGWISIVNNHPMFDGVEFTMDGDGNHPVSIECTFHRKDRKHPTRITEYFSECVRGTDPWKSHPKRMLRHKAYIQSARVAFGFGGIYDQDEAERILEKDITPRREDPVEIAMQAQEVVFTDERERLIADLDAVADCGTAALKEAWEALSKEQRIIHGGLSKETYERAKRASEFLSEEP